MDWPPPEVDLPELTRLADVAWLEPYPTCCSKGCQMAHLAPRLGMKPRKRSRWHSSQPCSCCQRGSAQC
jgi:hypothetical protein